MTKKKPTGSTTPKGASRGDEPRGGKRSRAMTGNANARKHGLNVLRSAMKARGLEAIDRRTSVGRALYAWRDELIADMGGEEAVTAQQRVVLDLAMRTKLMVDSIDHWMLEQPSLVIKRKRALIPAVRERQRLADSLAKYMSLLGLERREAPAPDFHEYVRKHDTGGKK